MVKHNYPRWTDLTPDQQAAFGNGCGAKWMPAFIVDGLFGWFFTASCRHHDFGYAVGGNEFRRWHCDWQFAKAMYRDTQRIKTTRGRTQVSFVMVVFYLAVVLFGWTRFKYGKSKTKEDIETQLDLKEGGW